MEREDPAWEERSILIFKKMKENRRKESGFSWADWVWEADMNIRIFFRENSRRTRDATHGSLALKAYQQNLYLEYYY